MEIQNKINSLKERKEKLIEYTLMKIDEGEDWHGAIDALMDVRDIEAKLEILETCIR